MSDTKKRECPQCRTVRWVDDFTPYIDKNGHLQSAIICRHCERDNVIAKGIWNEVCRNLTPPQIYGAFTQYNNIGVLIRYAEKYNGCPGLLKTEVLLQIEKMKKDTQ